MRFTLAVLALAAASTFVAAPTLAQDPAPTEDAAPSDFPAAAAAAAAGMGLNLEEPAGGVEGEQTPSLFSAEEQDELRRLVREYLIANPEVIEEAVFALQDKRDAEQAAERRAAIASLQDQLYNDPRDFAVGPVDAPVQIVEFFDYNCSFCRRSAPWVKELLETHGDNVRFVFKETPIFADRSESSSVGAKAAVAAIAEGRYLDLHFAMMEASGTIPVSQVQRYAQDAGLNWRRLQPTMDAPETAAHLEDGLNLLDAIGATGTPAFVVNGEMVAGADFEQLDALVEAALAAAEG
jgi:protein-disulfide isomerase